jgi:inhibitor of KinA
MDEAPRVRPAGDQALLVEFGTEISPEVNRRVQEFFRRASGHRVPGIGEMISSYCSALVYYDPFLLSFSEITAWAREFLGPRPAEEEAPVAVKEVPVLYGGENGPDLSFVARHNQISEEEVIRLHTGQTYRVYVVGFSPGFAAMGIGGLQTGIYAVESPGGWQLIGRTPLRLFDLEKSPPSFFQAGDYARFYAIDEKEFKEILNRKI